MKVFLWIGLVGGRHRTADFEVAAWLSGAQRTHRFCAFSAIGLKIRCADGEVAGSRWET